jgi:hypothetical protein
MSTIREVNLDTNEVIDREMNDEELAQSQADYAAQMAKEAELEARTIARATLLARLGITEEEAQLLIGGSN